jgi:hypothetical protein
LSEHLYRAIHRFPIEGSFAQKGTRPHPGGAIAPPIVASREQLPLDGALLCTIALAHALAAGASPAIRFLHCAPGKTPAKGPRTQGPRVTPRLPLFYFDANTNRKPWRIKGRVIAWLGPALYQMTSVTREPGCRPSCLFGLGKKIQGLIASAASPRFQWCRGTESNCRHGDFQSV